MKTFKKLLIFFLSFLFSSIFAYACYSFAYTDFNFVNWSAKSRVEMIFLSCLLTFLLEMFLTFNNLLND